MVIYGYIYITVRHNLNATIFDRYIKCQPPWSSPGDAASDKDPKAQRCPKNPMSDSESLRKNLEMNCVLMKSMFNPWRKTKKTTVGVIFVGTMVITSRSWDITTVTVAKYPLPQLELHPLVWVYRYQMHSHHIDYITIYISICNHITIYSHIHINKPPRGYHESPHSVSLSLLYTISSITIIVIIDISTSNYHI